MDFVKIMPYSFIQENSHENIICRVITVLVQRELREKKTSQFRQNKIFDLCDKDKISSAVWLCMTSHHCGVFPAKTDFEKKKLSGVKPRYTSFVVDIFPLKNKKKWKFIFLYIYEYRWT